MIISLMLLTVTNINQEVSACECDEPPDTIKALTESSTVFAGEVIEITNDPTNNEIIVKFETQRSWKGVSENQVTVVTGSDDGNCGFRFVLGETYLVYATGTDTLYTSSCSRNNVFADAYEDQAKLGIGIMIKEELPQSLLAPFDDSDLVLVGKVVSHDILLPNQTEYNIDVEKYLKNPKPYELITVFGDGIKNKGGNFGDEVSWYNEPIFNDEDKVFLYLKQEHGKYRISPYSFAIATDLARAAPPNPIVYDHGANVHYGKTITISGVVEKGYLYTASERAGNSTVSILVYNPNHELYVVDKLDVKPDGSFSYSFKIDGKLGITGVYEYNLTLWPLLTGSTFEYVGSPLKQFKSGINVMNIQCKENLQLVFKWENGSPACVKPKTSEILNKRGWTWSTTPSNSIRIMAQVVDHPAYSCPDGGCSSSDFALNIRSASTAYLFGYDICNKDSCVKENFQPENPIIDKPNGFQLVFLSEDLNLKWEHCDKVSIKLLVSITTDNKTAILIDLGNSTISQPWESKDCESYK